METTKKVVTATTKKQAVKNTAVNYNDGWSDTRLTCSYKGVDMNQKQYDIKMLLEKRAKQALLDCRNKLRAIPSKAGNNADFMIDFTAGNMKENSYHNSLAVQVVDKDTSILYQTGLHFILAVRLKGEVFINKFPFGNRTVTERERLLSVITDKKKIVEFSDGTVKAGTLEKLLFNCKSLDQAEAEAEKFSYPRPDISKGLKSYLAQKIAEANK